MIRSFFILITFIVIHTFSDLIREVGDDEISSDKRKMINFASFQGGAIIVDKSPSSAKGFHHLLNDDKDKYGICSCKEKKWVVIGLSEEIAITSIAIANYERYSSMVHEFQLLGSLSYPTSEWNDLGIYRAQMMLGEQYFNITVPNKESIHTRYIKFKILSHYMDEDLCTLSQIKVFGITVLASLKQEVVKSNENNIKNLLEDMENLEQDLFWNNNESGRNPLTAQVETPPPVSFEEIPSSVKNE
jgi:hypothetical protein